MGAKEPTSSGSSGAGRACAGTFCCVSTDSSMDGRRGRVLLVMVAEEAARTRRWGRRSGLALDTVVDLARVCNGRGGVVVLVAALTLREGNMRAGPEPSGMVECRPWSRTASEAASVGGGASEAA